MTYRLLEPTEWHKLKTLMDEQFIPSPEAAVVAVAEDESGELAGVLFLQLVLHMEPLVLRTPAVSFKRLHDVLHESVRQHKGLRYYAFSEKEVVDRMAEHLGMKPLPYKVFLQEVT
jgi:hypothetical protein